MTAARAGHAPHLAAGDPGPDRAKRLFDIVFAGVALFLTGPALLLAAALVRLSSPGPALYRKPVLGRGGRAFCMLKLRTMHKDAEARLERFLAEDPLLAAEWVAAQKLRLDPRITPVGAILRRLSADELPQLWNVLRGDMSLVGPRPYLKDPKWYVGDQLETFHRAASKILSVRPGITGLWAISGRANLSFRERVDMDALYVDRRSLRYDIWLILRTIPVVLFAEGAR